MSGGLRLFWMVASLLLPALLLAAVYAADGSSSSSAAPAVSTQGPPLAEPKPLAETLHGTRIVDNYRWLEDGKNPETQKWVEAEMSYTRAVLDRLPGREQIHKRLTELLTIGNINVPQIGGKYYFYTRRDGMQNQPVLCVREGLHGQDRVLVDANQLAADGTIALDWFEPSEHGKYVAFGTSPSGSEMSTLHIIETKTGKLLSDTIERTRAASIAWKLDNSGFYYTRYPKKGDVAEGQEMYNRHIFYHELGSDPADDPLIFGEGRDAEDWPNVTLSHDGRWLLIQVEQGWTKTELYLVFVTDATNFDRENWKEIIPQADAVLQGTGVFGGKLFAQYELNASSQIKLFDLEGKKISDLALPTIGTVFGSGCKWDRDELFYGFQSFTVAPSIYHYDLKDGSTSLWAKVDAPSIAPAAYEVQQEWYHSKDGTRLPMFIVHKKGLKKDGRNPTLVTAYGGFNVSLTPTFSRTAYLWMEHGGVYAVANLRGGAEFGEDWHRAGMLDKKQNVFDDMIAAAEHLIAEKYTDKNHLAIQGGSNGGLLMGAMITQRPDLFRAVICQVPLLDMLHYQDFQIAKLWIPEYGSAENPDQFKWLYAYSPYHHVKPGAEYPAILFMTADTDTRVDPMHAKKMAALMQAEAKNGNSRNRPILLRIETKAGHGAGKPVTKQIEEFTDVYSFLFWQLGVKP